MLATVRGSSREIGFRGLRADNRDAAYARSRALLSIGRATRTTAGAGASSRTASKQRLVDTGAVADVWSRQTGEAGPIALVGAPSRRTVFRGAETVRCEPCFVSYTADLISCYLTVHVRLNGRVFVQECYWPFPLTGQLEQLIFGHRNLSWMSAHPQGLTVSPHA